MWLLRTTLQPLVIIAALVLCLNGARADTWKVPYACKVVAAALKNGRLPFNGNDPLIKPVEMQDIPYAEMESILPKKAFDSLWRFSHIRIARFDYDGDGIDDLAIRQSDAGTAECEDLKVYKGIKGTKRVSYRLLPPGYLDVTIDDDTSDGEFCSGHLREFFRIGKRVYLLTYDDNYRIVDCEISADRNWKGAPATSHCEDPEVCAAVKSQADKLAGFPGRMLAGTPMPRLECDSEDEVWFGGWKIDVDNDGAEEFYVRTTGNIEEFLDARTPGWSECGQGFTSKFSFNPRDRWRFDPDGPKETFIQNTTNFIRVAGKNYWLLIDGDLKRKIRIVLVENGSARQVGTVEVGPPKISVKISRQGKLQ